MDRYPHTILIQRAEGDFNNPFEDVSFEDVYEGRCRCFINGQARFRSNKVMDSDYHVIIPNARMVAIGENYKANVSYNIGGVRKYEVIGYVKDFVRYDKVCEIFIQVVKENQIEGDVPSSDESAEETESTE